MSRRSGQHGYIERKGTSYYVRFWMDAPGQQKRQHKSVRLCPVSGLGKMTKPERERRAREVIELSGADTPQCLEQAQGVTFRQQAAWWLNHTQTRKRKPIKPATARSWENCLEKWLNPVLGNMPLAAVNNPALKELVVKMAEAGLSPKSMHNYIQIVKMVVASSVNEHGEPNYPRKWNHDFIDLPQITNQTRPMFTSTDLTRIVASAGGKYRVLYALLGGAGLRIGEALGLEIGKHVSADCSTLSIEQSVWNGKVQSPKTQNAIREVDLCPSLATMLREHIGSRVSGFVFHHNGHPIVSQSSILRRSLHPILKAIGREKAGFHSFRRFRVTWLRKNHVPEDLLRFWIGHATRSVTDDYSKLCEDSEYRKDVASRLGLGFDLPPATEPTPRADIVPIVPKQTNRVRAESGA